MSDVQALARTALSCLDLTSLNDNDDEMAVLRLCARAAGKFGTPAALCVWPRLAGGAVRHAPAGVKVVGVVNFPAGGADIDAALADVSVLRAAGACELDVVFPWRSLLDGNANVPRSLLGAVRVMSYGMTMKVILESGELDDPALIRQASDIALDVGADFLKTSTGKTTRGATPQAARIMVEAIRDSGKPAGFKASGGVRTLRDAAVYIELVSEVLGPNAVNPQRFRIGASGLLDVIESALQGTDAAVTSSSY